MADVNARDPANQRTSLWLAAAKGKLDEAKALIAKKADPNIPDKYGNTALIQASSRGDAAMVRFLVEHHADVTAVNTAGDKTALGVAQGAEVRTYLDNAIKSVGLVSKLFAC